MGNDYFEEISNAIRDRIELDKSINDLEYMFDKLKEKYGEETALKLVGEILKNTH